jgi:hypothetical protein
MGLIIAGMTHQGWDVQLGLRCSGLEGELLPSRDRALHRRRHRVGADAVKAVQQAAWVALHKTVRVK